MDKLSKEQLLRLQQFMGQAVGPNGRFTIKDDPKRGRYFAKATQTMYEFFYQSFTAPSVQNKTFIVYEDQRYTYAQSWDIIVSLGCELRFKFQVNPGDRVAIASKNSPEWCFSYIAAVLIGAIAVPLNSWWKEHEMEYGLSDSGSKIVLCDIDRFKRIQPSLEKLKDLHVILFENHLPYPTTRISTFYSLVDNGKLYSPQMRNLRNYSLNEDSCLIMYTSGTTGNPKGVLLSHRATLNQLEFVHFALTVQDEVFKMLTGHPAPEKNQQCAICAVPLFHVTATHHLFLSIILRGGKLVLFPRWDAGKALRVIETEKVTGWTGVPTMLQDLMEHPNFSKTDISSLEAIGSGGAPIAPSQVLKTREKFACAKYNSDTRNGYGMTETSGAISMNSGVNMVLKPTSCGAPYPIAQAKIIDVDTRKELPTGQRGLLMIRSSLNMTCYWNKPEATKKVLDEEGWLETGDIAFLDADNYIHIVDREKDIVIRGGENISCTEVENQFFTHPAILDCAVFGLPDERLGEVLGVAVYFRAGMSATPKELVDFVKPNLAQFKVPEAKNIFIWDIPLLKGPTEKTHKRDIKAKILADMKRSKL